MADDGSKQPEPMQHLHSPTPDQARRRAKKLDHEQQLIIVCRDEAERRKLTATLEYVRRSVPEYELSIKQRSGLRIFVQRGNGKKT